MVFMMSKSGWYPFFLILYVCIVEYFERFCLCTFFWLIGQLTFRRSHPENYVRQNRTNDIASLI